MKRKVKRMIKCENLTAEVNGTGEELFCEFTLIASLLYEKMMEGNVSAAIGKKQLLRLVNVGIQLWEERNG